MTKLFLGRLSAHSQSVNGQEPSETNADYYQRIARKVARQKGPDVLAEVLRGAVVAAYEGSSAVDDLKTQSSLRSLARENFWDVPKAHLDFAEYYSRLPADVRGPIITTNFDPFIEVALRRNGVPASTVPIAFDDPPSVAALDNADSTPVLHIHGFFAEKWTLNSFEELLGPRQRLQTVLQALLDGSSVLVLGYGGWEDAFMRVLAQHAQAQSLRNADIIWAAHEKSLDDIRNNQALFSLATAPSVQIFFGVDANSLFDESTPSFRAGPVVDLPTGFTLLPQQRPAARHWRQFADGARPTWADAEPGEWPLLSSTNGVLNATQQLVRAGASGLIGVIGPMGEGKSTGLMQVAVQIAQEHPEIDVLFREAGAPRIPSSWFESRALTDRGIVVVIDEADLAEDDLKSLTARFDAGMRQVIVLAAAQDRLWWRLPRSITDVASMFYFGGVDAADGYAIASRWDALGLQVRDHSQGLLDREDVALRLSQSVSGASDIRRSTLFGAILEVRGAEDLNKRVVGLLEALDRTQISSGSSFTLADVFGSICVLELAGESQKPPSGATRRFIASLVSENESLLNETVLRALGKEASIAFSGNYVLSRHRRIAEVVVDWLRKEGRMLGLVQRIARVGGQGRVTQRLERSDYDLPYFLGKYLAVPAEAVAAGAGAVEGANTLMEPRITYLSIARAKDLPLAKKYAEKVAPYLASKADAKGAVRPLMNELSLVAAAGGEHRKALGYAALVLHDGAGFSLERSQLEFGLGSLARALGVLTLQNNTMYSSSAHYVAEIASRIGSQTWLSRYVWSHIGQWRNTGLTSLGPTQLTERAAGELSVFSTRLIFDAGLPFGDSFVSSGKQFLYRGFLSFDDMRHLIIESS